MACSCGECQETARAVTALDAVREITGPVTALQGGPPGARGHEPSNMGARLGALGDAYTWVHLDHWRVADAPTGLATGWTCTLQNMSDPPESFIGSTPDAAVSAAWRWHQGHDDGD